jgi:hypothetical protein
MILVQLLNKKLQHKDQSTDTQLCGSVGINICAVMVVLQLINLAQVFD